MIGTTLANYRILEQIGQGGMARVYKAYDPMMDRHVAIKVLPEMQAENERTIERFRREAQAIARLEHVHILPVYAFGEENGVLYLVMRYMPLGTLADRLARGLPSSEEAIIITRQIASALDYAHSQNILHRDVKPSNILLDQENNAFLTDFGVAKMLEASVDLTRTGGLLGTPAYMSPEQCMAAKDLTPASDQYSLGVVLYEMLTGRTPYQADTPLEFVKMHFMQEPIPLPSSQKGNFPKQFEPFLLKALAREDYARFKDCSDFIQCFSSDVVSDNHELSGTLLQDDISLTEKLHLQSEDETNVDSLLKRGHLGEFDSKEMTVLQQPETVIDKSVAPHESVKTIERIPSSSPINSILLSPDGHIVLMGMSNGDIEMVSLKNWSLINKICTNDPPILSLASFPDGEKYIASYGNGSLIKWDSFNNINRRMIAKSQITGFVLSSDGQKIAVALKEGKLIILDNTSYRELHCFKFHAKAIHALVYATNDSEIITGDQSGQVIATHTTNFKQRTLLKNSDAVGAMASSPTEPLIAVGTYGYQIFLIDLLTNHIIRILKGHSSSVRALAFHPTGKFLLSASWDHTIKIWDLKTGEMIKTLTGHEGPVYSIALSSEGKILVSGGEDKQLIIWNIEGIL